MVSQAQTWGRPDGRKDWANTVVRLYLDELSGSVKLC